MQTVELTKSYARIGNAIRSIERITWTNAIALVTFLVVYHGNFWEHTQLNDYYTYIGLVLFSMVQAFLAMKVCSAWFSLSCIEPQENDVFVKTNQSKLGWLMTLALATAFGAIVSYNHLDHQFPLFGA